MRAPGAVLGRGLRAALLALALGWLIAGSALTPWQPQTIDWNAVAPAAPSLAGRHWLGTDALGRDAYARLVAGARVSLALALAAGLVAVLVGGLVGAIAGLAGGVLDGFLMRLVDVAFVLPQVFLILLLSVLLGRGPLAVLTGIAATGWLAPARVIRAEAIRLRGLAFVEAARTMGMSPLRVMWRHALPHLAAPLAGCLSIVVPQFVLVEGFISFLGLGVQEPQASLGGLLAEAAAHLERAPWLLLGPSLVLVATVFGLQRLSERWLAARPGSGA